MRRSLIQGESTANVETDGESGLCVAPTELKKEVLSVLSVANDAVWCVVRRNGTFKTCYSDVSTGTCDSHFDFLPAIFMRRRLISGQNLRKPVVNANTKPTVSQELEFMIIAILLSPIPQWVGTTEQKILKCYNIWHQWD